MKTWWEGERFQERSVGRFSVIPRRKSGRIARSDEDDLQGADLLGVLYGFVSLSENLAMMGMGVWMIIKAMGVA